MSRVRGYPRLFLCFYVLLGVAWVSGLHEKLMPHEGAFVTDFVNVYTAGVVVHEGRPAGAYDWGEQKNRQDKLTQSVSKADSSIQDSGFIPWLYPPMFLGIAWLVAFFPYFIALGVYSVLGFVAFGATLRKLAPQYKETKWALAAFPGVFINLFSGQNGFITTALLAAGLFLLEESPIVAGIAFGALSYKPHFFALIPLVLIVGRYWKALASTLVSAALCAGLSLIVFGFESWQAFASGLAATRTNILEIGTDRWLGILHSVFSMVRVLGGGVQTAYAIQTIVAGCAVLDLLWIWSRKSSSLAVRGASLAAALLLASPYSFVYDQVLLAIPIALLARQGIQNGFLSYEKTFLFALWLLPFLVQDSGKNFMFPLTPPMLIGLMWVCWRRMRVEISPYLVSAQASAKDF